MRKLLVLTAALSISWIPFGWLVVKIVKKEDIRDLGSGATGATNVYRVLGFRWAAFVALCDILKAYLPTRLAVKFWPNSRWLHLLVGVVANLGHTQTIFLRRTGENATTKGGKAVSTSAGAFFAMAQGEPRLWRIFHLSVGAFLGTLLGSKGLVSLASVTGVLLAGFYSLRLLAHKQISVWYGSSIVIAACYIIYMHRDNLKRMLRREEQRTKLW